MMSKHSYVYNLFRKYFKGALEQLIKSKTAPLPNLTPTLTLKGGQFSTGVFFRTRFKETITCKNVNYVKIVLVENVFSQT